MSERSRYQKILVPLDGSVWGERAIPHAVDLAQTHQSSLILLHVLTASTRAYTDQLALAGQAGQATQSQVQMQQYLNGLRTGLVQRKIEVTTQLLEGPGVAEAICDYVIEANIDLVVMSTHGRSGLARLLFGSVARRVLESVDVPVLLIRPDKE
ncbi:MAG: universal stress protein [Chloroflexi bacterium]|nr:universal stress protein [Chloroflexota bacterium]